MQSTTHLFFYMAKPVLVFQATDKGKNWHLKMRFGKRYLTSYGYANYSVGNKEKKLSRTFVRTVSTNRAGGCSSPNGGVRGQSSLQKIFRLCVALDRLKVGLNGNMFFCFFPEYIMCC